MCYVVVVRVPLLILPCPRWAFTECFCFCCSAVSSILLENCLHNSSPLPLSVLYVLCVHIYESLLNSPTASVNIITYPLFLSLSWYATSSLSLIPTTLHNLLPATAVAHKDHRPHSVSHPIPSLYTIHTAVAFWGCWLGHERG